MTRKEVIDHFFCKLTSIPRALPKNLFILNYVHLVGLFWRKKTSSSVSKVIFDIEKQFLPNLQEPSVWVRGSSLIYCAIDPLTIL